MVTKEREVITMKIKQQVLTIHQLDINDIEALEHAYKIVDHLQDAYGADCVMMSPNDGECVSVDELARVKGILSFIMCNRVVEVNPK
jgi:hypothetical protein